MLALPVESLVQSTIGKSTLLERGTNLVLRINENFNSAGKADTGTIKALVEYDVYSADGSEILIKAGTPAYIEFTVDYNGAWGKPGKVCLTSAYTKTVNNRQVALSLSNCKEGINRVGGVVVLSVLFFPLGLISGLMKGSMPQIQHGTTYPATVMQDLIVE